MEHDDYSNAKNNSNDKNSRSQHGTHVKLYGTVRMLRELSEGKEKMIDGKEFTEMVLVARIVDVEVSATRAKLLINDGSGSIQITRTFSNHHIDLSDTVGRYFRFFVFPQYNPTNWQLICQIFQPIEDMNALTLHMSNVMMGHMQRTKGPRLSKSK
jgi:hypothetical protein